MALSIIMKNATPEQRMAKASRDFAEAAGAVMAGDHDAAQLAADALEAISEARADLASGFYALLAPTVARSRDSTLGDRYRPTGCTCDPWEPCACDDRRQ